MNHILKKFHGFLALLLLIVTLAGAQRILAGVKILPSACGMPRVWPARRQADATRITCCWM